MGRSTLPQLLMKQFDTLPIQCRHSENMHEGVYKGYFHLCPRMDSLQTLHINNSLYTNYENVFIELDS